MSPHSNEMFILAVFVGIKIAPAVIMFLIQCQSPPPRRRHVRRRRR